MIKSREMECRFWRKKSHLGGWNTKLKGLVYWIEFKPFKLRFFKRLFLFNEGKTWFSNFVLPPEVLICLCYKGRTVVAIFLQREECCIKIISLRYFFLKTIQILKLKHMDFVSLLNKLRVKRLKKYLFFFGRFYGGSDV